MVDFVKFVKEHPGIDLKIEYRHDLLRGIVITMTKYPPIQRFRFFIPDEIFFDNYPYNLNMDGYIETWLNNGLDKLNKEDKNDQD